VGYAQDDMRMAVGSALMLVALGEPAYGELLGHHLREGFGTTTRPTSPRAGTRPRSAALEQGATPAFMPGQPERTALLRAATLQVGGGNAGLAPQPVSTLPTFSIQDYTPKPTVAGRAGNGPPLRVPAGRCRGIADFSRAALFTRPIASAKDRATT
jgi:hypothetical protein